MTALSARDARAVLDAVAELATLDDRADIISRSVRLLAQIVPCERAGWVVIDSRSARLTGTHWPVPVGHLLAQLPPHLHEIPLVEPLLDGRATTLRISDQWSRREWHSRPIWSDLYGAQGAEYQLASRLRASGATLESFSLVRPDRDFSGRDVAVVSEFRRHVLAAHDRVTKGRPDARALGLTPRQFEALELLAKGCTVRQAAALMYATEKTVENHVQEAYRRLGVGTRVAAIRRLDGR
jgi:DNA-binding CsgD family transcriptional regulator